MRERERHARELALDQRTERKLVRRIHNRPQQTNSDCLHSQRGGLAKNGDSGVFVEGRVHRAVAQNALRYLKS